MGKSYSYAGWIPNVHSHLSFSLIGSGRGPEVAAMSPRYYGRLCRFVCALQHRETDDFLAPVWWTRKFRPQASQDFILVGATLEVLTPIGVIDVAVEVPPKPPHPRRVDLKRMVRWRSSEPEPNRAQKRRGVETAPDDQGMLRGQIYVLPYQKTPDARNRQDAWLKDLRCQLHAAARHDEVTVGTSQAEVEAAKKRHDARLDAMPANIAEGTGRNSPYHVTLQFALFRTGEVRIWLEETVAARFNAKERRDITRQAYYFMKDMVHHHVHHDAKSDQITPLTAIGKADADQSETDPERSEERGEELWRRDTVWSLSRAVDALARRGKLQDLREATGILAYADAFQKTLLLYRRKSEDPTSFEPNPVTYRYDFAHIRESLKVQLDQVTSRRTALSQMIVAGLAGSIAATSLLVSAISAFNSAAQSKIPVEAIPLGLPINLLRMSPSLILVPAAGVGAFLWLVSAATLSEDRIGGQRTQRRKWAQLVRGTFNSVATRLNWTGRTVQRWLERFYLALFFVLGLATIAGIPYVRQVAQMLNTLRVTITTQEPATQTSPKFPAAPSRTPKPKTIETRQTATPIALPAKPAPATERPKATNTPAEKPSGR